MVTEEDLMIAIQNDDLDTFLNLIENYPEWREHYLREEDLYFFHYAASKVLFLIRL